MKRKIKRSAISKTFPFEIVKIKLKNIDWDVNEEFTTLTILECNLPTISNIPREKIGFGIYAYEGVSEAYLFIDLIDLPSSPISFNFIDNGLKVGTEKCRFRIYLFNKDDNKLLASSVDLPIVQKAQRESLLQILPGKLGNRIAELKIDDDGPYLLISTTFKTKKGKPLNSKRLLNILKKEPSFNCGFFPIILDKIFTEAYKDKRLKWSKEWIRFANMLVKGVFHKNEKLNVEDNEFKEKLREISTSWINKYNYDQKLFDYLTKGGDDD